MADSRLDGEATTGIPDDLANELYYNYVSDNLEILRKAVLSIIGFDLASERAQRARLCAKRLLEWMVEYQLSLPLL